jgi:hypothetical protein
MKELTKHPKQQLMPDIQASAKSFLHFGHRYEVRVAFKGWFDAFSPGERLVYLHSATSIYDSAIGFFFYDTTTGATKRYDAGWDRPEPNDVDFATVLKDLGPDMIVHRVPIEGTLTETSWECFREHLPYLRTLWKARKAFRVGICGWRMRCRRCKPRPAARSSCA